MDGITRQIASTAVKSSLTDYNSRACKCTTYRSWIISHIGLDKKQHRAQISHTFSSGNVNILVYIVIFFPPVLFRSANAKSTSGHKLHLQLASALKCLLDVAPASTVRGTRCIIDYSWEGDREGTAELKFKAVMQLKKCIIIH